MDTAIPTTDMDTMVSDTTDTITAKGPLTLSPDMDTDMVMDMATPAMDTTDTTTAKGLLMLNPRLRPSPKPKLNPLLLPSPDMVIPLLTDTDITTLTITARDPLSLVMDILIMVMV